MRKIRFTIGGLMAVVLVLALGFAALKSPNPIWAGVFWALTHGALGLAILAIFLRKGVERVWWLGFAVFEGGYLRVASSWMWGMLSGSLPTLRLSLWLRLKLGAVSQLSPNKLLPEDMVMFAQIAQCLWALLAGILGGVLARALLASAAVGPEWPGPLGSGTARTLWKPWLRAAVIVLVSLVLGVTVVAIWWTPEEGLWAGGMYLLTCGLFGLAVLGALFSRGRWREVCIGAGLFGVVYLYMALPHSRIPHREEPRIEFVTDQFLNALRRLVPPRSSRIASKGRILEALERPIAMRFFEETPLEDVLKYIAMATSTPDHAGIPIYVNPGGLQAAEKNLQSTVSIDLQGVPLKTTLRLCLEQLGLVYRVEDGCLQITIEDLIEDREDTRLESDDPFLIVGHCLLALIAAAIGGVLAPLVSALSRGRPDRPEAKNAPVSGRSHRPEESSEAGPEGGPQHA